MTEQQPAAGWYPDPLGDTTKVRYWNGQGWTNQLYDVSNVGNGISPQAAVDAYPPQGVSPTFSGGAAEDVYRTPGSEAGGFQSGAANSPQAGYQPAAAPGQSGYQQAYPQSYQQAPSNAPLSEPDKSKLWIGIGIASVFLLTWPLAIPQIVCASAASRAWQAGDLATYQRKLKTSKTCFIINICLMPLLVCGLVSAYLNGW